MMTTSANDYEDFDLISQYCSAKASSFDNGNEQIAIQKFSGEDKQRKISVPSKYVFQDKKKSPNSSALGMLKFVFDTDKENARPNNNNKSTTAADSSNKKDKDTFRKAAVASQKQVKELQNELKLKDKELLESQVMASTKEKEFKELSSFMSTTLNEVLKDMTRSTSGGDSLLDMKNVLESMTGNSGGRRLNKQNELLNLLASQENTIESLKHINEESGRTVYELLQLMTEKDQALRDMSNFNKMNDFANKRLLAHVHMQHEEELDEYEHRMKMLNTIICLKLREKYLYEREMALIKYQLNDGVDMHEQFVIEVKFVLIVGSILMALAWQKEYFVYVSPAYFLLVFFSLE